MEKVSFVIPCYRSAATIGKVIDEIAAAMAALPRYTWEAVLVNDCSPDDTFEVIRALADKDDRIIGVNLARNFGQHAALMAGFHQISGDVVVCLDDDGQTPADEVGKLLEKIEEGHDVVYASYEQKQHSFFRNLGSRVNLKMTEIMLGKPKTLAITSYFAARRFIVDEMLRYECCYPYVIGLVLRSTKNIVNVPVKHRAREEGSSGYTISKLLGLWMNGFTSFSVKPLRLATYLGLFSAMVGFLYTLWIIIKYFVDNTAPLGWSSIIAILLVLGGIILVVLGLIGEYVGRIYMCQNAAPQFVIRETVGKGDKQ
ncbi:MAG: glycosyltransferase family 2 protein [Clostridia bacterium]|nr:glycosyltransferase family 2 protein [Clostridia bacterium]